MTSKNFKIGTRKSQLALVQTRQVKEELEKNFKNVSFEIVEMSTKGDEVLDRALYKIGDKSLFTKELENALISKNVDMVVHSLKDLPSTLPDGLVIGAILERVSPADVIVIKSNSNFKTWEELVQVPGSVIGTSSVRRSAQLRGNFPNLVFQDIRGNLNTRLKKLDNPENSYDAIVLAEAGMLRLEWEHRIHRALKQSECLHAVGQGALAVECRSDDQEILELLKPLNHKETVLSVMAERSLMKFLDGGCSAPLAGHGSVSNGILSLTGGVWSLDGKTNVCDTTEVSLGLDHANVDQVNQLVSIFVPREDKINFVNANQAGIDLAKKLLENGAGKVLKEAKEQVHQSRN